MSTAPFPPKTSSEPQNGKAPASLAVDPAYARQIHESDHDRIAYQRDGQGQPLPDRLILGPLMAGQTALADSQMQSVLEAVEDPGDRARLAFLYERVCDAFQLLKDTEAHHNRAAAERSRRFVKEDAELRAEIEKLKEAMEEASADLRAELGKAEEVNLSLSYPAIQALSEAGAQDPQDFSAARKLREPITPSRAQAHEALGLCTPVEKPDLTVAKWIALGAAFLCGPFAGVGFFAKLGFISRSVVSSPEALKANAPVVGFAAVLGAAFFLAGGAAVEVAYKKGAYLNATEGKEKTSWLAYGLAALLTVAVLVIDTTLQHEGLKVLAVRAAGEARSSSAFLPLYAIMGSALILGMLIAKAYIGHLIGLWERHAVRASGWIDSERDADRRRREDCAKISRALDLAGKAVRHGQEVVVIKAKIAEKEAPFRREMELLESRRPQPAAGWSQAETEQYQDTRNDLLVASARLDAAIEACLGSFTRRMNWWQRLMRALRPLGDSTPRRSRK